MYATKHTVNIASALIHDKLTGKIEAKGLDMPQFDNGPFV